jgi:toxin-antitoxin system PIN domain toxin
MRLLDVNVLIYAHREDVPNHDAYVTWLEQMVTAAEPFALSEIVLAGFVRIVTNPRAFRAPTPLNLALDFLEQLTGRSNCRLIRPGPRSFALFKQLLRITNASGPFVADVYHAALCLEHGCEWMTTDADFARIPGLRWRHPLYL